MEDGARSRSTVRLRLPARWSVATPWERSGSSSSTFRIDNPERSFDRPTGWVAMGRIGVLREEVAGTKLAVAGPVGQDLRRYDLLALLRWTLPSAREVFGALPGRILLVGAGDPMWRGGLSGPASAFLHAARPLIAYDGTSPVLHEMVHVAMGARSGDEGDWVAEGLAEYYALELLARSKTLSRERVNRSFSRMAERGRDAGNLYVPHATGDLTARAAIVMRVLDRELRRERDGEVSLDDVAALLTRWNRALTPGLLRAAAEQVAGRDLADFFRRETGRVPELPDPLPGAPTPADEPAPSAGS
jgi:predicted metalloprotease with PDZ domain